MEINSTSDSAILISQMQSSSTSASNDCCSSVYYLNYFYLNNSDSFNVTSFWTTLNEQLCSQKVDDPTNVVLLLTFLVCIIVFMFVLLFISVKYYAKKHCCPTYWQPNSLS